MECLNKIKDWFVNLPWNTISFSTIIEMIAGVGSTLVISWLIYWLQDRHEKEIQRIEEAHRISELHNQADQFLIKHAKEGGYLPWCLWACRFHKHEEHTREIYTDFCGCSKELQIAIFEKAGLSIKGLSDNLPIHRWIDLLKTDISTYRFGRDILYDGAKYFFRGYLRYRKSLWDDTIDIKFFTPLRTNRMAVWARMGENISWADYTDDYFTCFVNVPEGTEVEKEPIAPIDYFWYEYNIADADEETVCRWVLEMVSTIAMIIHNSEIHGSPTKDALCDMSYAEPATFEDKYYQSIQWLCCAYNNIEP